MRTIIAGSRNITDYRLLLNAVEESGFSITEVVSGKAKGVDKLGERYALEHVIPIAEFPAKWNEIDDTSIIRYTKWGAPYNALAGIQRNELMSQNADAAIILWDGKSSGTKDMLKRAKSQGLKVYLKYTDKRNKTTRVAESRNKSHINSAIKWAEAIKDDKDALVIDTEYCGASANDEVIALGIVRLQDGEVLFNSLLKPNEDVTFNWFASQVHNISEEHLYSAPRLSDVWDDIYDLLHNKNVLAYNYSADKRMLFQTVRKHSLEVPDINWHCVMNAYKQFTGRAKSVNLTRACEEMDVKSGGHDALGDALAAARIVHRIAQNYKIKEN